MTQTDPKLGALKKLFADWQNPIGKASKDDPFLERIGSSIYGSGATKDYLMKKMSQLPQEMWTPETLAALQSGVMDSASTPFSMTKNVDIPYTLKDGTTKSLKMSPFDNTLGIVGSNIAAHPGATLGTAANLGMNVSGLFDNDKFGGQLVGSIAGAAIPKLFGMDLGPLGMINAAGIGGNLGALFDKLREKKAQEQQQYGGNY